MTNAPQNLRELLALARMLRRFAEEHTCDNHHDLFMATATALEDRAHMIANAQDIAVANWENDRALHAPVNCMI
jgi:hypothetical protein